MRQLEEFTGGVVLTAMAGMAVRWWVLPLMGFHSYFGFAGTDADLVRTYYPCRMVQPDWVVGGWVLMKWTAAEVLARLGIVALVWAVALWRWVAYWRKGAAGAAGF